jgi:hypothetical protein
LRWQRSSGFRRLRSGTGVAPDRRSRSAAPQTVVVQGSNKLWRHAFPPHGHGRKHERAIALEPWRAGDRRAPPRRVDRRPYPFRRLSHDEPRHDAPAERPALPSTPTAAPSSRTSRRTSAACSAPTCELLDVGWAQSNPRNISVAQRKSVTLLDALGLREGLNRDAERDRRARRPLRSSGR